MERPLSRFLAVFCLLLLLSAPGHARRDTGAGRVPSAAAQMRFERGLGFMLKQEDSLSRRRREESLVAHAAQLYSQGHYAEASSMLSVVLKFFPENDAACYYLGLSCYSEDRYAEAEKWLKKAVALDPGNFWYRQRLAGYYSLVGDYARAVEATEALVRDYPRKTDLLYTLADLHSSAGQYEKVLEDLDRIEALTGKDSQIRMQRARYLLVLRRADEAAAVLEEEIAEDPSPVSLSLLADLDGAAGRDSLAAARYGAALASEPDYPPALIGLSELARVSGMYPEYFRLIGRYVRHPGVAADAKARYLESLLRQSSPGFMQQQRGPLDSLYAAALAQHPKDSSIRVSAALYAYATGRPEEVVRQFNECCLLFPDSKAMVVRKMQILGELSRWDEVEKESLAAAGRFRDPALLDFANAAAFSRNDYAALQANARRAISLAPADSSTLLHAYALLGDCYQQTGPQNKVWACYEKALKINPDYAPVLNNYAYRSALQGRDLRKAAAMSEKTIRQEPDNPTYLDSYGWILFLQGKPAEAKTHFKRAMLYGGKEEAEILSHYAQVLFALGDEATAAYYWSLAREKAADTEDFDRKREAQKAWILKKYPR